jgi:hypothetical protein
MTPICEFERAGPAIFILYNRHHPTHPRSLTDVNVPKKIEIKFKWRLIVIAEDACE